MMKTTTAGISPPAFFGKTNLMNNFEIANIGGGDMIAGGSDFGI